jgi:hypothetical protein
MRKVVGEHGETMDSEEHDEEEDSGACPSPI